MARKRKGRRRPLSKLPFQAPLALGNLGDNALTDGPAQTSFVDSVFIVSAKAIWSMFNHTAGEGPIEVGYAHSDLTAVEILERLTVEVLRSSNYIEREQASRPVRIVGMFRGLETEEVLNHGEPIHTKIYMPVRDGQNIQIWAHNLSNGTLTTGTFLEVAGNFWGRWGS